jgi:RNA polymerase sigma factor (sigma-70 family)
LSVDTDAAAFAEFYSSTSDDCLRVVLATVRDRQIAEDLVAEAFARAWASWHKVSRHPAPRAWVVRTAMNAHHSWWRRRQREVIVAEVDEAVTQPPAEPADGRLMAAVLRLPLRQRQVIACRLFLDLDTAQTAVAIGIAPGTVTAHLARGIAALRGEFAHLTYKE